MSAANENSARLTQFKNKGKDVAVSIWTWTLHEHFGASFKSNRVLCGVLMVVIVILPLNAGVETEEDWSERGAPES